MVMLSTRFTGSSVISIVVSAIAAISMTLPLRSSSLAAAGIAVGSALGSYVNLGLLARGLRRRLGPLYTPAMWKGTRRIMLASLVAVVAGSGARLLHQHFAPEWHVRVAAFPVLGVFGASYLLAAWWMGSAEAARWLRRRPRHADSPSAGA
jgi:putative peptidoglycan lipid II flippase